MLLGDHAVHGDRPQIGDFQIIAGLQLLDTCRIEAETEARRIAKKAEKHHFAHCAERPRLHRGKQRLARRCGRPQHDQLAADHITPGQRVFGVALQHRVVAAASRNAVDRTGNVAKPGLRTEIEASGHDDRERCY